MTNVADLFNLKYHLINCFMSDKSFWVCVLFKMNVTRNKNVTYNVHVSFCGLPIFIRI